MAEALRTWASAEDEPDKLILPLEHAYTPAELSFGALKGADARSSPPRTRPVTGGAQSSAVRISSMFRRWAG